jgi:hypothetical protein
MDCRFTLGVVAASAEEAMESLRTAEPGIIVLDHGLSGRLTGLDAAPRLKELVPQAKIIMFTAHADLKARADNEPAIDGFVLKTESNGCGSSEGTLCGLRNGVVGVAGLVDASLFLVEVVAPVGLEVAVAA